MSRIIKWHFVQCSWCLSMVGFLSIFLSINTTRVAKSEDTQVAPWNPRVFFEERRRQFEADPSRIWGGELARPGMYPWQVSLFYPERALPEAHFCAGIIVAKKWIVTAAHCVEDKSETTMKVKYGTSTLTSGGNVVDVEKKFPRTDWKRNPRQNDIALLKLKSEIVGIEPIRPLSNKITNLQDLYHDKILAYVSGWGLNEDGKISDELRHVGVEIVSNEECNKSEIYNNEITKSMLCAGYVRGGRDACKGDSGGPLMVSDRNGGYLLAGIVSATFTGGCARPNKFGVYTRVIMFSDWDWIPEKIN